MICFRWFAAAMHWTKVWSVRSHTCHTCPTLAPGHLTTCLTSDILAIFISLSILSQPQLVGSHQSWRPSSSQQRAPPWPPAGDPPASFAQHGTVTSDTRTGTDPRGQSDGFSTINDPHEISDRNIIQSSMHTLQSMVAGDTSPCNTSHAQLARPMSRVLLTRDSRSISNISLQSQLQQHFNTQAWSH